MSNREFFDAIRDRSSSNFLEDWGASRSPYVTFGMKTKLMRNQYRKMRGQWGLGVNHVVTGRSSTMFEQSSSIIVCSISLTDNPVGRCSKVDLESPIMLKYFVFL